MKNAMDVMALLGAVERRVSNVERDNRTARMVVATRVYEATVEDVWDALTSKERIPRWFLPIEGNLEVGGRYQLTGNAGGTVLKCNPPKHFEITWGMGGNEDSWVDVRLELIGPEKTRLVLEHVAIVPDEFWNQYGPGAVGLGWELGLLGLYLHLRTGGDGRVEAADVTAEGKAWAASPEGIDYQSRASESWGEASIAAGTDAAAARAAAARTTAAYTGGAS
jgi:uncharacterized protein YndB with AHSA1/START domain